MQFKLHSYICVSKCGSSMWVCTYKMFIYAESAETILCIINEMNLVNIDTDEVKQPYLFINLIYDHVSIDLPGPTVHQPPGR